MIMDLSKSQYKDLADAVGMPDEEDKKSIELIISRFERRNPGVIQFHRDAAKEHMGVEHNRFAEMSKVTGEKNSARRYMMELPPELHMKLEQYIPTLFSSKKHFAWFCKNFKSLLIPKDY